MQTRRFDSGHLHKDFNMEIVAIVIFSFIVGWTLADILIN